MTRAPLYRGAEVPGALPPRAHRGLWYERFFSRYESDWQVEKGSKLEWIETVTGEATKEASEKKTSSPDLERYLAHHRRLVAALGGRGAVFSTEWNFVTGLGLPHPVENGFAWHPTLGLPYLPATGIKGLLGAWLDEWAEPSEPDGPSLRDAWLGTPEQAGSLVFFDALPTGPVALAADVVTPAMGQWYARGASLKDVEAESEVVPADWHSPIPSPFLAVESADLYFSIAPRGGAGRPEDAEAALGQLAEALATLGAGAKTAAGYGRMHPQESHTQAPASRPAGPSSRSVRRPAGDPELAHFQGFDPPVERVIRRGSEPFYLRMIEALEKGPWTPAVRARIAGRLQEHMQAEGLWAARGKNLRAVLATREVEKWLEAGPQA